MSRPIMVRHDTKADEDRQRREVLARDGDRCRCERLFGRVWHPCTSKSTDTAHIIRRPHLSPKSRFHVDVALRACRACHDALDGRRSDITVRVPPERARKAWTTACALSKVPPPAHYNPDALSAGKG